MKPRTRLVIIASATAMVVGIGVVCWHLSSPRIVARAVSPDGVEMCIVQQCNWDLEPFTTSFLYRKEGALWGWFYYDHQDGYWGRGRVSLDTDAHVAVFYRAGSPAVTFEWVPEVYTLHRWARTLTNAQETMPAGWSPKMSVYSRK